MSDKKSFAAFSSGRSSFSSIDDSLEIVYQDKFLAVVNKPAGMASQPGRKAGTDVINSLSGILGISSEKIYLVNRLDQPVSGLMLIAFSPDIQSKLNNQQNSKRIIKKYLAVTAAEPEKNEGSLLSYLIRDGNSNTSKIVDKEHKGSKLAVLHWKKISGLTIQLTEIKNIRLSLLEIKLDTGRHHQIRVQLSGNGWPIFGDAKYYDSKTTGISHDRVRISIDNRLRSAGIETDKKNAIALLSWKIEFDHPITGKRMRFVLPYPTAGVFCLFSEEQKRNDQKQQKQPIVIE